MADRLLARLQCAAITRGCMNFLIFEVPPGFDLSDLNAEYGPGRILGLNGWHLDHGRWVCGAHERGDPESLREKIAERDARIRQLERELGMPPSR